jgi:DNA-binding NarL/FixJ family response regulator
MTTTQPIRVFIVDDHPVVVAGLTALLRQLGGIRVAGSAANAFQTIPFLKENPVDLVLLDINLPDVNGIELCRRIKKEFPGMKVLALSTFSDRSYISRMIGSGASGYLIKSADREEISTAVHTAMAGRLYLSLEMERVLQPAAPAEAGTVPRLTRREQEVLELIAGGLTNHQIAEKLFISPLTVDSHRKNLLTKLGVKNTAALVRLAVLRKLV